MRVCWVLCVVLCVVLASAVRLAAFCAAEADGAAVASEGAVSEDAGTGHWELLPLPESASRGSGTAVAVDDIGMDTGGTVYLLTRDKVYFWDGAQFAPLAGLGTMFASPVERFVGGPDRGLYIADKTGEAFQGKLYRLEGGEAEHVTDFYCESEGWRPLILVAKSGRLINWGKRFVAAYADGKWSRVEAPTVLDPPLVFDTGSSVHAYVPGWLCTVDEHGALTTHELDDPVAKAGDIHLPPHGMLWEKNVALLFGAPGRVVWALDLRTGEAVGAEQIGEKLDAMDIADVVPMDDGSVWLYVADRRGRETGWRFVVLGPDGRIVRRVDPSEINWQDWYCASHPDAVLKASDGTIWFAESRGGIVACRNGTFTHFGWRDGIRTTCNWLAEGPDGTICAGATKIGTDAVYVFRETKGTYRPPAWMELWHEFPFASGTAVPDFAGGVWMCVQERPGMLSRWDGKEWHETPVPFDTTKVRWLGVDDQGRVIARVWTRDNEAYLIGPDGAAAYGGVQRALQTAVEQGARRFRFARRYPSVVVLDDGRIWCVRDMDEAPWYYDGNQWQTVEVSGDKLREFRHDDEHGVLLVTTKGKAYAYADHKLTLVGDVGEPPDSARYGPGDLASRIGGCWTQPTKRGPLCRQFGERMVQCDFSETPLPSRYTPEWMFDDAAGNVWIEGGSQGTPRHMFMKQVAGFELKPASIPAEAAGSVTVNIAVVLDEKLQAGWRLFYRLNGGEWLGGDPAPELRIEFPEGGTHKVEVIGMGPLGETTPESVTFTVRASSE